MTRKMKFGSLVTSGFFLCATMLGQQPQKPLTNDGVLALVRSHKSEAAIVSQIQSRPSGFDMSPHEIIRLSKAGVTEKELDAMTAAANKNTAPAIPTATSRPEAPAALPQSKSRMPKLNVMNAGSTQELPLEKTQLAETKTKPSSMKSLASDSIVTQAMQSGVNEAASTAAMHMNYGVGGQSVQQAGSVFSSVMGHRQPKTTYVWGVPGPASANVLQSASPAFTIDFSRVLGVAPDDYAPAIVKLTPAQNTCRIIGATQGKADARSTPAADWQIYSNFLEERVNSQVQKLAPGKYKIAPASEMSAGEYGIVLRPVSKTKPFSGGDVARGQGDGLMFDAVWTFQISEDAQ
jgi:hypothetical protein